eukprot:scaffold221841_cov28-Tisochrysis_lutea.AAC.1
MPCLASSRSAKPLLPSICERACEGPTTGTPAARSASATPASRGASGPITARVAPFSTAKAAIFVLSSRAPDW